MPGSSDALYYAQLQAGAEYLAETTADPEERLVHLKMANVYRSRSLGASGSAGDATFH